MKFIEHIQTIDNVIAQRKEEEYRKAIFGVGAITSSVGLGAISSTRPNAHGGYDTYVNGRLESRTYQNQQGGINTYL